MICPVALAALALVAMPSRNTCRCTFGKPRIVSQMDNALCFRQQRRADRRERDRSAGAIEQWKLQLPLDHLGVG